MKINAKNLGALPDGKYQISDNLFFRVRRNGSTRSFVFRYQTDRKRKEFALGSYPKLTLADAKELATRNLLLIGRGIDPAERRLEAKKAADKHTPTFQEFFDFVFPTIVEVRRFKTKGEEASFKNKMRTYALPVLGSIPINEISRDDVLECLRPVWGSKCATAKRVRQYMYLVFNYAITNGYMQSNPAAWEGNLSAFLPSLSKIHTQKHYAAFTPKQASDALLRLLDGSIRSYPSRMAIVFGMLTATRSVEFTKAEWSEIDFDHSVWSVPPERRKDGKKYPFRVPLSDQAVWILHHIDRITRFVFQSQVIPNRPISSPVPNIYLREKGFGATMHGCRATFSSWAAENGVDMLVRETCLMHNVGNAVAQAYQRSDLLEQRREVMQAWADFLIPMETLKHMYVHPAFSDLDRLKE